MKRADRRDIEFACVKAAEGIQQVFRVLLCLVQSRRDLKEFASRYGQIHPAPNAPE
jgi:hypothetical protein